MSSKVAVKSVPNGMQGRGSGVRGIDPYWSLEVVDVEKPLYVKRLLGFIFFLPLKRFASKWRDVGEMICWARDECKDLEVAETGIGGTPGVPYAEDKEYWVRFLRECWKEEFIPEEVIANIRGAANMFAAREIAMAFHDKMLASLD